MPFFGHHLQIPSTQSTDPVVQLDAVAPQRLQRFLGDLGQSESKEDVWALMIQLCADLGQPLLTYGFTQATNFKQVEFNLRSNAPDVWKSWLFDRIRTQDWISREWRTARPLGLFAVGIAFLEDYEIAGTLTPEFEEFLQRSSDIGWASGLLVPLRSVRRMEYGGMTIAGEMDKHSFLEFAREHGWTFSVAALQAHQAYREFIFLEEAEGYDLSPRHLDFLRQSARGYEIKEIAHNWQRSQQYVTRIRREVCERLGVTSKMAVMAKAARLDILMDPTSEDLDPTSGSWD